MAPDSSVHIFFEGTALASSSAISRDLYTSMRAAVLEQPGFISESSFVSVSSPSSRLLYAHFDSEQATRAWRNNRLHLDAQSLGRAQVFSDYRIRVGRTVDEEKYGQGGGGEGGDEEGASATDGRWLLIWQYTLADREEKERRKEISSRRHEDAKVDSAALRYLVDAAAYISDTRGLQILAWSSREAAMHVRNCLERGGNEKVRVVLVERNYGKFRRREAPVDGDEDQE